MQVSLMLYALGSSFTAWHLLPSVCVKIPNRCKISLVQGELIE